jgi:hypothetical protein
MPVRYFGIFLAYGPTVDLRREGLGRLMAAFLQAAATKEDVKFVIACPQWFKRNLFAFCESEGIPATAFEVVSTEGMPFLLRLYLAYLDRKGKPPAKSRLAKLLERVQSLGVQHRRYLEYRIVAARSALPLFAVVLYGAVLSISLVPVAAALWCSRAFGRALSKTSKRVRASLGWMASVLLSLLQEHGEESLDLRLYRMMEDMETQRMRKSIDALPHVKAWFCPTAFWPAFNEIVAPRLLCVPDVLLTEFPIGFTMEPEMLKKFETVERSIRGSRHFVTYSAHM